MPAEEKTSKPENLVQERGRVEELNNQILSKQDEWARAATEIMKSSNVKVLALLGSLDQTYLRQLSELVLQIKELEKGVVTE